MRGREIIGRNIRARRVALGLSIAALAARCGYTADWVGKVERGQMNISIDRVDVIAGRLGTTFTELAALPADQPAAPLPGGRRSRQNTGNSKD